MFDGFFLRLGLFERFGTLLLFKSRLTISIIELVALRNAEVSGRCITFQHWYRIHKICFPWWGCTLIHLLL